MLHAKQTCSGSRHRRRACGSQQQLARLHAHQAGNLPRADCALDKAPITLYSMSSDASQVLILGGNTSGKPKTPNVAVANNPWGTSPKGQLLIRDGMCLRSTPEHSTQSKQK